MKTEVDTGSLLFSDEEEDEHTNLLDNFIDDRPIEDGVSLYSNKDPLNINDCPRFQSQTRNPIVAIVEG